jgi:hypothetical protein
MVCHPAQELLDAAEGQADPLFAKSGQSKLIIRPISEKQGPASNGFTSGEPAKSAVTLITDRSLNLWVDR